MDDVTPKYTDAVTLIARLMQSTFGAAFKAYYEGDPLQIPKDSLPCIIVEVVAGNVQLDATSTDRFQTQINIKVVFDKSDDYGASDDFDLTERKLRQIVEARDKTTGNYLPNSILGALRRNFTLGSHLIGSEVDWQYDVEARADDLVTSEAVVQILTTERIIVGQRL